jgi:hypothetical protein
LNSKAPYVVACGVPLQNQAHLHVPATQACNDLLLAEPDPARQKKARTPFQTDQYLETETCSPKSAEREIPMIALDSVLADLVDSDRECAYVTVKREPLEALIDEWACRGDHVASLCRLLTRARNQLAQRGSSQPLEQPAATVCHASPETTLRDVDAALAESASANVQHRHAMRRELAARLKQVLRAAIAEVGSRATDALLAGNTELAERLESERQTVRIVMSAIDATVDRLLRDELMKVEESRGEVKLPA